MAVGGQTSSTNIDSSLTDLAVSLRNIMTKVQRLNTMVNGQGQGLAFLEGIGYSNAANPDNPGGISDAAWALQAVNYLNTLAGCYFGTVQQGGTGGTGAINFDFDNAFALLWAGQLG